MSHTWWCEGYEVPESGFAGLATPLMLEEIVSIPPWGVGGADTGCSGTDQNSVRRVDMGNRITIRAEGHAEARSVPPVGDTDDVHGPPLEPVADRDQVALDNWAGVPGLG